jgi:hypothetical protein
MVVFTGGRFWGRLSSEENQKEPYLLERGVVMLAEE